MDPIKVYLIGVLSFLAGWTLVTWQMRHVFRNYERRLRKEKGEKHG